VSEGGAAPAVQRNLLAAPMYEMFSTQEVAGEESKENPALPSARAFSHSQTLESLSLQAPFERGVTYVEDSSDTGIYYVTGRAGADNPPKDGEKEQGGVRDPWQSMRDFWLEQIECSTPICGTDASTEQAPVDDRTEKMVCGIVQLILHVVHAFGRNLVPLLFILQKEWDARDWNKIFQEEYDGKSGSKSLADYKNMVERINALHKVQADFIKYSREAAKLIVRKKKDPIPDQKGMAGGSKYRVGKVIFKFPTRKTSKHIYNSLQDAQKAEACELRAMNSVIECNVRGLHVPLTCLFLFRGQCLLAEVTNHANICYYVSGLHVFIHFAG